MVVWYLVLMQDQPFQRLVEWEVVMERGLVEVREVLVVLWVEISDLVVMWEISLAVVVSVVQFQGVMRLFPIGIILECLQGLLRVAALLRVPQIRVRNSVLRS